MGTAWELSSKGLTWSLVQRMFTRGRLWAPSLWKAEEGFGPGRKDNEMQVPSSPSDPTRNFGI